MTIGEKVSTEDGITFTAAPEATTAIDPPVEPDEIETFTVPRHISTSSLNAGWIKPLEMTHSNDMHELFGALAEARAEFKPIIFDQKNPYFDSKFASLNAMQAATTPALSKHGVTVIHCPTGDGVRTIIAHSSGQYLSNYLPMQALKDDAQGVGGGITYAIRYNYAAMLNIAGGEDGSGNAAVAESFITDADREIILKRLTKLAPADKDEAYIKRFCKKFNVESTAGLTESQLPDALKALDAAEKRAKKMSESSYTHKENRGSLFKNEDRTTENHPNSKGSADVGGKQYWVSGWWDKKKDGTRYLSLAFKEKEDKPKEPVQDFEPDDIPF